MVIITLVLDLWGEIYSPRKGGSSVDSFRSYLEVNPSWVLPIQVISSFWMCGILFWNVTYTDDRHGVGGGSLSVSAQRSIGFSIVQRNTNYRRGTEVSIYDRVRSDAIWKLLRVRVWGRCLVTITIVGVWGVVGLNSHFSFYFWRFWVVKNKSLSVKVLLSSINSENEVIPRIVFIVLMRGKNPVFSLTVKGEKVGIKRQMVSIRVE